MHEQWKKRKMFSNREQGIMSGLDPVPMVQGGYVPYPGMQTGGVVPQPQLFEEGDAEVNDALNSLASITKPDVPDMLTPKMEDKPEAKKEVTKDQGFSDYKQDVMMLKEKFKDEIMGYLSKGATPDLRDYLTNMNITYTNQLDELKKKHNVEMDNPEDKLMTPEFVDDLMRFTEAPGMEEGGAVPIDLEAINTQQQLNDLGLPFTIQAWLGLTEDGRKIVYNLEQQRKAAAIQQGGTTRLDELLQQREGLVDELGDAAAFEYKTKEGGTGGLIGKLLAQRAGKAKARDKILSDQISAERLTSRSGGINTPAKVLESIVLGDDREIEKKITEYRKTYEDDYGEDASDAAIGRLALDGIAPPKSSGPIYQQSLSTPTGDQTFIEFFNMNYKRLLDAGTTPDGEALAAIVKRWRAELAKN